MADTSMAAARRAVNCDPGHTAYWYMNHGRFSRVRRSWLYKAFERALNHGMIRYETDARGYTIYFPTKET